MTSHKVIAEKILLVRMIDQTPDLSYLETDNEEDKTRLESYNNGNWYMMGITTKLVYRVEMDTIPKSWTIQYIHSGGLWGIESDSGEDYLQSIEKEEIRQLKKIAKELGISIPKKIEIVRSRE